MGRSTGKKVSNDDLNEDAVEVDENDDATNFGNLTSKRRKQSSRICVQYAPMLIWSFRKMMSRPVFCNIKCITGLLT